MIIRHTQCYCPRCDSILTCQDILNGLGVLYQNATEDRDAVAWCAACWLIDEGTGWPLGAPRPVCDQCARDRTLATYNTNTATTTGLAIAELADVDGIHFDFGGLTNRSVMCGGELVRMTVFPLHLRYAAALAATRTDDQRILKDGELACRCNNCSRLR